MATQTMAVTSLTRIAHLQLDDFAVNVALARRLPAAIARRFNAVPVAEDNGRVTVAVADPDDTLAREAIAGALGASSCVVGCDPQLIDALLAQVWPEERYNERQFLVCAHASPQADEVAVFAQALGTLLNAHISYFRPIEETDDSCEALVDVVGMSDFDLVIWGEPRQSTAKRWLGRPIHQRAIAKIDASLLLVRRPRWPLRRILLVVRGEEADQVAAQWVVHLARPAGAAVTVLAIVPPVPAMYEGFQQMQHRLDALLTTGTALGRQMRRVARSLVDWELEGTLRLRQGTPDVQICREIAEGNYDLVAVAPWPQHQVAHKVLGDRITSLLCWADQPVLIAKPKNHQVRLSPN
jgi:nucleotide-binding universal stress UspA family protein